MSPGLKAIRPFIRLMLTNQRRMALGLLLGFVAVASAVGLLSLAGWFLTAAAMAGLSALSAGAFNFFYPSVGVRLFAFGRTLSRYFERVVNHDTTFRILEGLRVWLYSRVEPLSPALTSRYHSGDILGRMVEDIDTLDNLYLRVLSPSIIALSMAAALFVLLSFFDLGIAAVGVGFLFFCAVLVSGIAGRLGAATGKNLALLSADLRIRIIDGISGIRELLIYSADQQQLERITRSSSAFSAQQRKMSLLTGLSSGLITLITGLAVLVVLYLGVNLVTAGGLHSALLPLLVLAVQASFEAVLPLPTAFQYFGRTHEAANRLLEIAEAKPAVSFPDASRPSAVPADIRFVDINFQYTASGPPSLKDINCRIQKGQRVAVIGETGSGKSTLVHLLVRFWEPTGGQIFIGNTDIRTFRETDLRQRTSVVSQTPYIFSATLRDNLLMARPGSTDKRLLAALEAARLLPFVQSLPDGLDTWVGENGRLLSGGQAKRLTLARAFLHDAPLWILDEPTEGLDRVTEKEVMQSIYQWTAEKSVILVTHRLEDMQMMDSIILLEKGRILGQGNHQTLMQNSPPYAALYNTYDYFGPGSISGKGWYQEGERKNG